MKFLIDLIENLQKQSKQLLSKIKELQELITNEYFTDLPANKQNGLHNELFYTKDQLENLQQEVDKLSYMCQINMRNYKAKEQEN